jgi:hypothetical protein
MHRCTTGTEACGVAGNTTRFLRLHPFDDFVYRGGATRTADFAKEAQASQATHSPIPSDQFGA